MASHLFIFLAANDVINVLTNIFLLCLGELFVYRLQPLISVIRNDIINKFLYNLEKDCGEGKWRDGMENMGGGAIAGGGQREVHDEDK